MRDSRGSGYHYRRPRSGLYIRMLASIGMTLGRLAGGLML